MVFDDHLGFVGITYLPSDSQNPFFFFYHHICGSSKQECPSAIFICDCAQIEVLADA